MLKKPTILFLQLFLALSFFALACTRAQPPEYSLVRIAEGFSKPTDIQFFPHAPGLMLVAEKDGHLKWHNINDGTSGIALSLDVAKGTEEGLLGLAFHPSFKDTGKVFLNYVLKIANQSYTRISEWRIPDFSNASEIALVNERVLLEVLQPYSNHNAGQLAFGPDGYLYIGLGDGGSGGDPHGHGQNRATLLGSMLRIDVNSSSASKPYVVPNDNPFIELQDVLPEIFAYGLRNPWRYSFNAKGDLIVADVGQNLYEEVSIVTKGANMGWNIKEATHCFKPTSGCDGSNLVDPFFEYGREQGQSVTGGYEYSGRILPELRGKYIFGDFVSGRVWAAKLPEAPGVPAGEVKEIGKWPVMISTFGKDTNGEVYLADFMKGEILQLSRKQS